MLDSEDLKGAAILIYANKQDLPDAMNAAEITEKMSLTEIKDREWHIQVDIAVYFNNNLIFRFKRDAARRKAQGYKKDWIG